MRLDLDELFPKGKRVIIDALEKDLGLLDTYGITKSRTRLAIFLTHLAHESGGLTIYKENWNYTAKNLGKMWDSGNWRRYFKSRDEMVAMAGKGRAIFDIVYSNRMGNGPPSSGDGSRFCGRGLFQVTGKEAYELIGKLIGLDLVNHPELAERPENLMKIAVAFWSWKKLNALCDANEGKDVVLATCKRINGGTVGLADRRFWYTKVTAYLNKNYKATSAQEDDVLEVGDVGPRVKALQDKLNELNYKTKADGKFGTRTRDKVLAFQADHGLTPTGKVDKEGWAYIEAAQPREISEERQNLTLDDLREQGSEIIKNTDTLKKVGIGVGTAGAALEAVPDKQAPTTPDLPPPPKGWLDTVTEYLSPVQTVVEFAKDNAGIVMLVIAGAVVFYAYKTQFWRLKDAKEERTI